MITKNTKTILAAALFIGAAAQGATNFESDSSALAGAEWDVWTFASSTPATGSQGAANSTFGSLINSSETTTTILQGYDSPPGGFLGNPDTYYFHNGAATWTSNLVLSSTATFVRVSYSLIGFAAGPLEAYSMMPSIAGATALESGSYDADGVNVFYTNLALNSPTSNISATFGDIVPPGFFPGSFRSVDAIQVEVFNTTPEAIPEPSVAILAALGGLTLVRRKRR